jgi:ribosome biogenesis GTPase
MYGKIVKGVGGFYYVHLHLCQDNKIYECRAKGSFRNQKVKPKIGDNVEIDILDDEKLLGNITKIYPRENDLVRPAVSNVEQAIVVFALKDPKPNFNLLDRFLIMLKQQGLNAVVCINKCDLYEDNENASADGSFVTPEEIKRIYESAGHRVVLCSTKTGMGIDEIKDLIAGKTTVFAGPSGVGKSSLLNALCPHVKAQTGELSQKIKRGKHTTRHSELMYAGESTFIMDTPGFSSLEVFDTEPEDLKAYYGEFDEYEKDCRFNGCVHINEPDCAVKTALENAGLSSLRYDNYRQIYDELKSKRKW